MGVLRLHAPDAGKHGVPPRLHSISASIAVCHSGNADSFFGSFVMSSAASFSVSSFRPSGKMMGSPNGVDQGTQKVFLNEGGAARGDKRPLAAQYAGRNS